MIDVQTQNDLFNLISRNLKNKVIAYAFGGTAMMFYGYKNVTKDIDLIFEKERDRDLFISAIEALGYKKRSLLGVYSEEKQKLQGKPVMYTRGDERFDLFIKNIFGTFLKDSMKTRVFSRHDFIKNSELIIYVLSKEDLILLKAVTEREKDFDDILTIIEREKNIDWEYIISSVISQNNSWTILDFEKTLQKLRDYTIIKKEYFDRLYDALDK